MSIRLSRVKLQTWKLKSKKDQKVEKLEIKIYFNALFPTFLHRIPVKIPSHILKKLWDRSNKASTFLQVTS